MKIVSTMRVSRVKADGIVHKFTEIRPICVRLHRQFKCLKKRRPRTGGSLQVAGRKRFGYYVGEAGIIAKMETLRATGLGFDTIANRLNAEGVPSRSGKMWSGVVVNRILTRTAQGRDPRRELGRAKTV